MLPVSNRTERLATLIAIAVGWLLILSYLVMLLANLISALRDGATDNLLARTFSFAGIGVDQPWLEAYALANVVALIVLFSLATRAMLGGSLAVGLARMASVSPTPTPHPIPMPPSSRTYTESVSARAAVPATPLTQAAAPAAPMRDVPGFAPDVFISHSSHDNTFGKKLAEDLAAALAFAGSVWYDACGDPEARCEGLRPGESWWEGIQRELTERSVFVLILTLEALASPWGKMEIETADTQAATAIGKVLIPVFLGDPSQLAVPPFIARVQGVTFADRPYEKAFAELLEAVKLGYTRFKGDKPATERLGPPFSPADLPQVDRLIGRDSELERDPLLTLGLAQGDESVQMALENSFDTLPEAAQRLLVALAAFASADVGRKAALALGVTLLQDETTARAALQMLEERSILNTAPNEVIPTGGDRDRVRRYPLVVTFTTQRFAKWSSEKQRAAYETVAKWYAAYAAEHFEDLGALSGDETNIVGALEWIHEHAADNQDMDVTITELNNGMARFWRDTGHVREGLTHLPWGIIAAEKVAAASRQHEDLQRGVSLADIYGELFAREEKRADASTPCRRNFSSRSEIGDRISVGVALSSLGQIALRSGWLAEAERCFQQSLAITREMQNREGEGTVLFFLGRVTLEQEQLAEAEQYFQESLRITREMPDQQGEGTILFLLGQILRLQGHYLAAASVFEEALALLRSVDDKGNYADGAVQFGRLLIEELHQPERGCGFFAEAIQIRHDLDLPGEEEARATAQRLGCAV